MGLETGTYIADLVPTNPTSLDPRSEGDDHLRLIKEVLQNTFPNADGAGAAAVQYLPAGTGAVATDVQSKLRESVSVKDFGAVGDGVTDDTAAFVAANTYLMTKVLPPTNQVVESQYVTLVIPEGIYKISGHRIFGSQIPTGNNGTTPPRMLQILGQGASLVWNVVNEDDELFYFDGTIANPRVSGLTIFPVRSSIIGTGAGVLFRFYSNLALTNQGNASKFHMEDVTVWPGRNTSGILQKPKYIFLNTGNAMCDQMLIEHCRFYYMQKCWVGQNDQAVNVTFSSCGFFGASQITGSASTTYFDFTRMNDNFNVVNCTFSIMSGETLVKTLAPASGGFLVEGPDYNFNFDNNRIELVSGTSNVSWNLCDMNFGKLNFRNTSLAVGGGSTSIKTIVRAFSHGNVSFDNVNFNTTDFFFPIATADTLNGGLTAYGAYFRNCRLIRNNTTYNWTDGVTNYAIKNTLITNAFYWQAVRFEGCNFANGSGLYDWEFVPTVGGRGVVPRKSETVTYSVSGVAFGQEFRLPPYQMVKKITLNMNGTLPETFATFRVWIGDRTLANTYDVDNIRPGYRKNAYVLFEGNATVFYADTTLQSIEVALLDGASENNTIASEITVEYAPLDPRAVGITTNADQFKLQRLARAFSSGATSQRPDIDLFINQQYFDTSLQKPIWWNGTVWKDATGTTV
jgi:hypothetical protein